MNVQVKLFASLMRYLPTNQSHEKWVVDVEPGTAVDELIAYLNLPRKEIKLVFLNGIHASGKEILKENDRLGFFPAVAGG